MFYILLSIYRGYTYIYIYIHIYPKLIIGSLLCSLTIVATPFVSSTEMGKSWKNWRCQGGFVGEILKKAEFP